jgi:hypothetical protein
MGVTQDQTPPPSIRAARRALEGVPGVSILDDWIWSRGFARWALHLRLRVAVPETSPIPEQTEWYVLVESDYPLGSIKLFPASKNSFNDTYPHQLYNGPGEADALWRKGEVCLNSQTRKYDRYEDEPFAEQSRLLWHCLRATEWLEDAANSRLVKDGDPFEIPQFPGTYIGTYGDFFVAYQENHCSLERWQAIRESAGLVEFLAPRRSKKLYAANRFLSLDGRELLRSTWGRYIGEQGESQTLRRGVWTRTPAPPLLPPWQVPATWGELRKAFELLHINLDAHLRSCFAKIRDGHTHFCLIGFPVPERFGGANANVYWLALALPAIAHGRMPGFRDAEPSHWTYDHSMLIPDNQQIAWVHSENWDVEQVSTRGRLSRQITSRRVLLIGGGAIGSALAELLVRGGVQQLVLIDSDNVTVGNLTRHTLNMDDAGEPKAVSLARRLNTLSPHASALGFNTDFPPTDPAIRAEIDRSDLVFDCTGSDEVARQLEAYPWTGERLFFSLSTGVDARRMFCFSQSGRFDSAELFARLRPWLMLERSENRDRELPREGIGCWNPVFPARADDVWLLVSLALSTVDQIASQSPSSPDFVVFERVLSEGRTIGVKKQTSLESGTL